ncbi:MAG: alpha/beta hydrolase [Pseudomonadales bacterium]
MIRIRKYNDGLWRDRSARSVLLNTALRVFVKRQFSANTKPPVEMREFMQKYIEGRAKYPDHVRHWEDELGGVPTHWLRAGTGETDGAILYLHGGAFVVETPRAHGAFVSELASRLGMVAAMPSYRLAPEEPFPAAVDDVIASYRGLLDLGIDPAKIVVAGDSAGGNLTLVLMQQCKKLGLPIPAVGIMLSPGMDLSGRLRSHLINTYSDPMFNQYALQQVITHYLQDDHSLLKDERVSPMRGDFKGLPPLCFIASNIEIFRDCSIYAAKKAGEAGVEVECHIWKGMPHCFPVMFTKILPEAEIALQDMVNFAARHLGLSQEKAA